MEKHEGNHNMKLKVRHVSIKHTCVPNNNVLSQKN